MKSIAAFLIFFTISALVPAFSQTRGAADGASALTARLERLEEHVATLQGVLAAVETLAKNSSGGYAAAGGGASADQIRQLSEQIADLNQRLRRLEGRSGSNTGHDAEPAGEQTGFATTAPASGFEDKEQLAPLGTPEAEPGRYASRPYDTAPQQSARAGQSMARPYDAEPASSPAASRATPAAAPTASSAKALFDQAYAAYSRREYSAAETYFQQFMDQFPKDPMAGTAQYWLGETAFSGGEYRTAADRFLKTFTNFPNNERAPEALLKLAISLRRLGENAAACDSFAELQRRYPQGPKAVLQRADVEKKRANCT